LFRATIPFRMAAILEVRQADAQRFRLDLGVTCVGRGSDNLIQITDPSVSNRHCEIVMGPDGTVIRDLGSTNGTFVAGQRVQVGCLNWDEPFRLGNVECVLRPADASQLLPSSNKRSRTRKKIDREGWKALGLGLGLAVVICLVPLLAYIIDFLRVIIHETGHTVTDWLFGYPAIPILRPGGAVSAALVRPTWMMVLMLAVLGKVLYDAYRTKRHPVSITIGVVIYLLLALSGLDRCVISAMGHGAELMVASLFLYRALSGQSILHRAERPLYATVAFVIFGLDVRFAAQLLVGNEAETEYREGFDGQSHDLVRIAEEYLHVEFRLVVTLFLVLCLLAPFAVFLSHRYFGCARLNQRR
jgi:FHA domain